MEDNFSLNLDQSQAKELCLLLRKNQQYNSKFLSDLETEVESFLFNTMTIDEAEEFFHEN